MLSQKLRVTQQPGAAADLLYELQMAYWLLFVVCDGNDFVFGFARQAGLLAGKAQCSSNEIAIRQTGYFLATMEPRLTLIKDRKGIQCNLEVMNWMPY